ncbi:hypothetical protein DPMN_136149 [Dreissena polymorpha]|uniref:Monocarboxylate transporter n=2 Tax=Dreissena polymorpha TaxID=45954 RepID=A0A9D4JCD7_DREPO|nr:hypothetical protein DPMN_136149 [Dreissena polymorpha]
MIASPELAIIGAYFNKHRGLANSIFTAGGSLGGLAFAPVVVKLFDEYGYTGAMLIISALLMHSILSGLLMRPIELYSLRRNKGDSKKEEDTSVIFGDGKDHDKSINKARGEITDTNYDLDDELDVDDERETAFKGSGKSLDQRLKNAAMQSYDVDIANRNQQGSPLISRARAHSYNAKRSRTLSECTEVSKSTLTKVIQAIDRSEVALYASGECIFGSFIGINSARKHLS